MESGKWTGLAAFAAVALFLGTLSLLVGTSYAMGGRAKTPEQAPSQTVESPQENQMKSATVKIKGMYCAGCAVSIRKELEKLGATGELDYNHERAVIHYDPSKANLQDIQKAINKIGYTCELPKES